MRLLSEGSAFPLDASMVVDAKCRRMATGVKLSDDLLRMFRALGDETRVRLLQRLREREAELAL